MALYFKGALIRLDHPLEGFHFDPFFSRLDPYIPFFYVFTNQRNPR